MGTRTEKWITTLIAQLDSQVDEETRNSILEQCGRQCQTQGFIKKARKIHQESHSTQEFLHKLAQTYKHLHVDGNDVYITYPRCYCTQVNKIPKGKLSATYCNCSRGWAKALFEGAIGRPVEVVTEQTIVNGDSQCRFRIII